MLADQRHISPMGPPIGPPECALATRPVKGARPLPTRAHGWKGRARDRAAEAALCETPSKLLWARPEKGSFGELRSQASALLWRWRDEGLVRSGGSLPSLTRRLRSQMLGGELERQGQLARYMKGALGESGGEESILEEVATTLLWRALGTVTAELPPDVQKTFAAARAAASGGPKLASALGLSREQARKKLLALKLALIPKAISAGLIRVTADGRAEVSDASA